MKKTKRSTAQALRQAVGVGESRDWSFWFMIAIMLGLVANAMVLVSCLTPSLQPLYLFRVDSSDLVAAAAKTSSVSAQDLAVDALPSHWYWGLTGVCVVHSSSSEPACKWAFPPVMAVDDMVTFAVETKLGAGATSEAVAAQTKPWTEALSQVQSHLSPSSRPTTFFTVSFASALASSALSVLLFVLGLLSLRLLRGRLPRWILYLISALDAACLLAAGVLLVYAMNEGPRGLINYSAVPQGPWHSYVGSSLVVLFVGVLFKFLAIPLFFCLVFFAAFAGIIVGVLAIGCCCGDDDHDDDEYPFCEYPNDEHGKA